MSPKSVPSYPAPQAKFFLAIDPNALSSRSPEGDVRTLHRELGACMFNAQGSPLQYFRQSVDQKFGESEYRATIASGITHTMSLVPKPGTARIRLSVCDTATGMIGSVDVPYPSQPFSAPVVQTETKP